MDYRILGPLEVCDGGRTIELGGDKQRALLGVLLLRAGEIVSADDLIDALWGEQAPSGAHKALQAHVSRLRKALDATGAGDHDRGADVQSASGALQTRGHGYVLVLESGALDADRFRELLEQGRRALAANEPEVAAELLRECLALWRGPPLADFTYESFAQAPIRELEELRLGAIEERVDADLELGLHEQLVGELKALVEQHPLRERPRGQLMVVLYRCGRQAEALETYQAFRRRLSEELGLDPSPRLQQLEAAILARDESLDAPREPASVTASVQPGTPSRARRQSRALLALGAAGLGAIALAVVLLWNGGGGSPPSAIAANAVGAISATHGAITAVVPLGSSPAAIAAGERGVWVASYSAGTVSRIDPAAHAVVETIPTGATPSGIAVGAGAVWVANNFIGKVSRIDPNVNRVVQTITVGNGPSGIAVGEGSVWVANSEDGTLSRINAATGAVVDTIPVAGVRGVAVGLGAVWATDAANGRLVQIDPRTDRTIQFINVGTGPGAVTTGYGSVWVANGLDGTVSRVDPQTNLVAATIPVGDGPSGLALGPGGLWVASEFGQRVARIAPATNTVATAIRVGSRPRGITVAGGLVWVSAQSSLAAHRGGTLTVRQNAEFGSLDPARPGSLGALITLWTINDGLTSFKRVGGPDGAQLVPDLAVSLPAPTDGGLTYRFRVRSGIRYSNGQLVRAVDFRRAIERDFELGPGAPLQSFGYTYFEHVVGAPACVVHPRHCDLSRGIVADNGARTVTFHLSSPDAELPAHLSFFPAGAVPASAPDHDVGAHPLPVTGPYDVAVATPREVKLVRNPYFHEWSHAAQPDGYPDHIIWRLGGSVEAAVTAVEQGTADYTLDPPPPNRLAEVRTRFASQLNVNPTDETLLIALNTRARPFTDGRVRRALSYAIDRARLARLVGQDSQPMCQMLAPLIPGHQPYCPYTLNPSAAGTWSAPDVRKAQKLIAESGTRGTPITIWNQPGFFSDFTSSADYLASLLDRLGYPTRIKTFSVNDTTFLPRLADSRSGAQLYLYRWGAGFPLASELLGPQFWSCESFVPDSTANSNVGEFCDRQFDATVRRALAAEALNSPAAGQLWARADRQFTDAAPVVPFANPGTIDLVSRRVGNYQYNAQLGALIDQLWVR